MSLDEQARKAERLREDRAEEEYHERRYAEKQEIEIGFCKKCKDGLGHSLINDLCWNCRQGART